jgi:hypothetical protein
MGTLTDTAYAHRDSLALLSSYRARNGICCPCPGSLFPRRLADQQYHSFERLRFSVLHLSIRRYPAFDSLYDNNRG